MGIEPTSEAWEASILPLNYARSFSAIVLRTARSSHSHSGPGLFLFLNPQQDSGKTQPFPRIFLAYSGPFPSSSCLQYAYTSMPCASHSSKRLRQAASCLAV